ncbi:MAG: hypothetical protein AAF846_24100 [Chloroflexota bacterium]
MRDVILQHIQQLTGLSVNDITLKERPRLTYQGSNLYDVRFGDTHWIAKQFLKEAEFTESPQREYDALNLVKSLDIAPQPIDYLPYPEYEKSVVLYEFMQGNMWDRRKPSSQELTQLAELWLQTYSLTRDDLWLSNLLAPSVRAKITQYRRNFAFYLEWAHEHFVEGVAHVQMLDALLEKRSYLAGQIDDSNTRWFFSRSDPRFANIIARPDGRIGLVDWEDSGLRNPLRTIADLLYHANQEDLVSYDDWDAFLIPYFENYPKLDDHPQDVLHWYSGITPLAWLCSLLAMGVRKAHKGQLDNRWQVNTMPVNQRLRRYVAHTLSWEDKDFEGHLAQIADMRFFDLD